MFRAFGAAAVVVVVRTQVGEAGLGVGKQMPDGDQNGAPDRDDRSFLAAAFGDTPVALAREGVNLAGGDGGFSEDRARWRLPCPVVPLPFLRPADSWTRERNGPRSSGAQRWGTGSSRRRPQR